MSFRDDLTDQEQEILEMIESGLSPEQIAEDLDITPTGARLMIDQLMVKWENYYGEY